MISILRIIRASSLVKGTEQSYTVADLNQPISLRKKNNCGHSHKKIKDAERCLKSMKEFSPKGNYAIVDSKTFEEVQ